MKCQHLGAEQLDAESHSLLMIGNTESCDSMFLKEVPF